MPFRIAEVEGSISFESIIKSREIYHFTAFFNFFKKTMGLQLRRFRAVFQNVPQFVRIPLHFLL